MLTSIRRYWAMFPGSIAAPAFIVGGGVAVISSTVVFFTSVLNNPAALVVAAPPTDQTYQRLIMDLGYLDWFVVALSSLALLAGLVALYKQWRPILDWLGRLGLLLAAIGFLVRIIYETQIAAHSLVALVLTGSTAYSSSGIADTIELLLLRANRVTLFALWGGIALLGIYVLRARASLLPGWARGLLLIMGLWGLLIHTVFAAGLIYIDLIPAIVPAGVSLETRESIGAGLSLLLSLPAIVLWLLLGIALLSDRLVLPVQIEPIAASTSVSEFVSIARPYRPRRRR
jgi:hypothetical protein